MRKPRGDFASVDVSQIFTLPSVPTLAIISPDGENDMAFAPLVSQKFALPCPSYRTVCLWVFKSRIRMVRACTASKSPSGEKAMEMT